uniref:NADH-ubiquinone oxidoreductase chain 5 n=1 Tax=Prionospio sp. 6 MH-2023 TaxID=3059274 RepID=A0AAU6QH63_9ANNE
MTIFSIPLLSATLLMFLLLSQAPLTLSLLLSEQTFLIDWTFFSASASPFTLTIILDPHGSLFSCVVLFISMNVMVFSHSYMKSDPFMARFTHLVLLFVLSMNLLIFIPNLIALLLGWDGLGLVSFLLVIYYQNPKSLAAGMITALTNRVGDALILLSIGWTIHMGQWNLVLPSNTPYLPILATFLMLAAMTKSAQLPFSSWLPAAMAAPTPVSALVHSSTLVTAGVFLIFRFYPLLASYPMFKPILLILATLTTLMAGLSANTECDMKKVIALSTLSQLGVMMVSMGLGAPLIAFFHLITHALFKALLFLCAGTLIHLHLHSQDLRFMGNLSHQMPSIAAPMMISNLALCGAPFLAGFYSKDMILEFSLFSKCSLIIIALFFFATGLTVSYTARFLNAVIWGPTNLAPFQQISDMDLFCSAPTTILASSAIFGGASLNWILVAPYSDPVLALPLKTLTLLVSVLGLTVGYSLSSSTMGQPSTLMSQVYTNYASCTMWFLAPLSTQKALPAPFFIGHSLLKTLDQGWEEMMGGQGALASASFLAKKSIQAQKSMTTSHLSVSMLSATLLFLLY